MSGRLTGGLVFVFKGKDGIGGNEGGEGGRNDVHNPLMVGKPASKDAERSGESDL